MNSVDLAWLEVRLKYLSYKKGKIVRNEIISKKQGTVQMRNPNEFILILLIQYNISCMLSYS